MTHHEVWTRFPLGARDVEALAVMLEEAAARVRAHPPARVHVRQQDEDDVGAVTPAGDALVLQRRPVARLFDLEWS